FYVWAALGVVFVIAIRQSDFGPMKKHEDLARKTGQVMSKETKEKVDISSNLPTSKIGRISDLIAPLVVLFIATLGFIYWTGLKAVEGEATLINIFGSADVPKSLLYGGLTGLVVTFVLFMRHLKSGDLSGKHFRVGLIEGTKSMIPGFSILIFAWAIVTLIGELGTGTYLAGVVESSNLSIMLLPLIVFIMAGFIAFATGTSWGSFGILLPIAGEIAVSTDVTLLLPMLAAVLAGAVFGDHCSPISDTTILSSTGSNCDHMDHVSTQIPYALLAAGIAGLGYLVLGIVGNVWVGLLVVILSLVILFFTLKKPEKVSTIEESIAK
ncbi:Na+/H+ antiporter NhaC family protein, partial [Virgibacillus sp. DJP39]|uniref:Na+/H+ antiporter NhaC family protein n=1 Tax=Virgibacillus sp. DJP39 TaxID=3409790 RepID=UPI003BB6A756